MSRNSGPSKTLVWRITNPFVWTIINTWDYGQMTGRRLWMIPLIWVVTVAGASTLSWTVISAAGARVGQPVAVPPAASAETSLPHPNQASRTWTGRGGRLTATCAGEAISLGTAVPTVGYWVKVYDPGPETLRVDFESTDPDDHSEVRIGASCQDGSPEFRRL